MLKHGIIPKLAKRYTPIGSGLWCTRWVVGGTLSWIHQFKRLCTRFDRRLDTHQAFLTISCCIIYFKQLTNAFLLEALKLLTSALVCLARAEKAFEESRAVITLAHSHYKELFVRGVPVVKRFPRKVWINKRKAPDASRPGKI